MRPYPKKGTRKLEGDDYRNWKEQIFERDGWQCAVIYPGGTRCSDRRVTLHHIIYRSRRRLDEDWNATSICVFHHQLVTDERIKVVGRAPDELTWEFVGLPNETRSVDEE